MVSGVALAAAVLLFGTAPVEGDHFDGNMPNSVNYWIVEPDQIRVCDLGTLATTAQIDAALNIWNTGIGRSPAIAVQSCANPGVEISDEVEGTCPDSPLGEALACAIPPTVDSPVALYIHLEPDAYDYGESGLISVIAHEFGHNLGFDHVAGADCRDTIMAPELCTGDPLLNLTAIDQTNYHNGYHVDAVASPSGSSPSAGAVSLSWNPANLHNEMDFSIWRLDNPSPGWNFVTSVGKNAAGASFGGEPSGLQTYGIYPRTSADVSHYYGDGQMVQVNVTGAGPGTPSITSVQTISPFTLRINWSFGSPAGTDVHVERAACSTCAFSEVGTDTASPFDNTGLAPGTTYWYRIRAHNHTSGLYSPYSAVRSGATSTAGPSSMTSTFTSTSTNRLTWAAVSGAANYRVCTDLSPSGGFSNCTAPVTTTSYNAAVPTQDAVQWYNKVKACNAASQCTALSATFTLTERVTVAGWNYAFTFYRSSGSIIFRYVNFTNYGGVGLNLALHVKNGSSGGSPTVFTTSCVAYLQISGSYSRTASSFSSGILGTIGHTVNDCALTNHAGDGTPYPRWGYIPGS